MRNPVQVFRDVSGFITSFLLLCGLVFSQCWKRPFYYRLIINNMYDFGYRSLFIVISFGVIIGVVLTYHMGLPLMKYGAKLYVSKIMILSLFSEVGNVVVVFILAGKIGAGISSEIASMKVSDQLDALRALGVSSIKRVVVPKVLACLIIIPILCIILNFVAFLTSAITAKIVLHLDPINFIARGLHTPDLSFFLFGVFKTIVFALCIAITSCYYGLNVKKGSYEVGLTAMRAIVVSFILIIFGDLVLTIIYYMFFFKPLW